MKHRSRNVVSAIWSASIGRVVDAGGEQARQPRADDDADDRHHAEHDPRDRQQPAGQLLGAPSLAAPEVVDEGRHEHGRQRARGEQLEEHVRDAVRRLEGVAEVGRAEHRRDDHHAQRRRRPATRRRPRPCRRPSATGWWRRRPAPTSRRRPRGQHGLGSLAEAVADADLAVGGAVERQHRRDLALLEVDVVHDDDRIEDGLVERLR